MGGSVLDYEAHDKKKVDRVIDRILEFSDVAFPGWRSALEWMIFTVTKLLYAGGSQRIASQM